MKRLFTFIIELLKTLFYPKTRVGLYEFWTIVVTYVLTIYQMCQGGELGVIGIVILSIYGIFLCKKRYYDIYNDDKTIWNAFFKKGYKETTKYGEAPEKKYLRLWGKSIK